MADASDSKSDALKACGFKSHLLHKKRLHTKRYGAFFGAERPLPPWFKVSAPLRSAQSRGPPDLVRRLALLRKLKLHLGFPPFLALGFVRQML